MESTMYNCTTTLFNQINGKYRVEGSTIFLSPAKDLWKNGNTCAPSSSKQQLKTPVKKELQFDLRTDEQGKRLLCIVDGESETCYRREEN
jgi:hypothetical protein